MNRWKVVISDYYYKNLDQEKAILASVDAELLSYHCKTEDEVIQAAADRISAPLQGNCPLCHRCG